MIAIVLFAAAAAALPAASAAPAPFGQFGPEDLTLTRDAAFAPDGATVYFTKTEPGYAGSTIFVAHRTGDVWSAPEVAPFSGRFVDLGPSVTPAGDAVVFASRRPPLGTPARFALYEALLTGPQRGSVVPLPNDANDRGAETAPSVASDGSLYFTLNVSGHRTIERVATGSQHAEAVVLPGDASGVNDFDASIAASGVLVFASDRPGGTGGNDLYATRSNSGAWCAPVHLPPPVNSESSQVAPSIARDGHTLFFASTRTSVNPPMPQRLDAAGFRALLERYDNGDLRIYSADIAAPLATLTGEKC